MCAHARAQIGGVVLHGCLCRLLRFTGLYVRIRPSQI
jgi:hypothetical protein